LTNEQETSSAVGAAASTGVAAALNDMARPLFPSVQAPPPSSVTARHPPVPHLPSSGRPRSRPEMVDLYELQVSVIISCCISVGEPKLDEAYKSTFDSTFVANPCWTIFFIKALNFS